MKIGPPILSFIGRALHASDPAEGQRLLVDSLRSGAAVHHIDFVELNDDCRWLYPHVFNADLYRQLREATDEIGIEWTVHLPIVAVDPCAANEIIRRASVEAILDSIEATRVLEPQQYVLHAFSDAAGRNQRSSDPTVQQIWPLQREQAAKSVESILREVNRGRVCMENLPELAPEQSTALAREFGTALCFDVGHLMLFGGDPAEFLDANLAQVQEFHLHDVLKMDGRLVDHQALGTGIVPVADLVQRFAHTDGYLTVEVFGWRAFNRSMSTLSELGLVSSERSPGG